MNAEHPSELFLRFTRRNMIALLFIVIILGGSALALMLSSPGAVGEASNLSWWLLPVLIVIFVAAPISAQRGRWSPDAPEVRIVMEDEFRRANVDHASRIAFIVVLLAQWPLAMAFGFFMPGLPQPRSVMVMAASTITLGLVTVISLFLYFDRD